MSFFRRISNALKPKDSKIEPKQEDKKITPPSIPNKLTVHIYGDNDETIEIKNNIDHQARSIEATVGVFTPKKTIKINDADIVLDFYAINNLNAIVNVPKDKNNVLLICTKDEKELTAIEGFVNRAKPKNVRIMIVAVDNDFLPMITTHLTRNKNPCNLEILLTSFPKNGTDKSLEILYRQFVNPLPIPQIQEITSSLTPTEAQLRSELTQDQRLHKDVAGIVSRYIGTPSIDPEIIEEALRKEQQGPAPAGPKK